MRALGTLALVVTAATTAPAHAQSPCSPQPGSSVNAPLTKAQCLEASAIVARDATLHRLLAGRKYTVGRPDPWGSGDGTHNIGAVVHVRLAAPLTVARVVLPVADFNQSGSSYVPGRLAVSLRGTTSLDVFVGFRQRRVVWIIPFPGESEGPPPTSIPSYTAPPGFAVGTGGATSDDAQRGLVLHLVTFDNTGRLLQEEWLDPLRGKATTNVYNPERKLVVSFISTVVGRKLTVTTIDYVQHTWTTGSGSIPTSGLDALVLDSRTLPERLREAVATSALAPDGAEQLGGVDAQRFRGPVGLAYFGISFRVGSGELWLDPGTYLPIQQTIESGRTHAVEAKTLYSWLPRTATNAGKTAFAVPTGYKHTASTGLPHIFGD